MGEDGEIEFRFCRPQAISDYIKRFSSDWLLKSSLSKILNAFSIKCSYVRSISYCNRVLRTSIGLFFRVYALKDLTVWLCHIHL